MILPNQDPLEEIIQKGLLRSILRELMDNFNLVSTSLVNVSMRQFFLDATNNDNKNMPSSCSVLSVDCDGRLKGIVLLYHA